jgi:hypothetical protein
MFSCWVWELYQGSDKILQKDGPSANRVEDPSSKAHSIPSCIIRDALESRDTDMCN